MFVADNQENREESYKDPCCGALQHSTTVGLAFSRRQLGRCFRSLHGGCQHSNSPSWDFPKEIGRMIDRFIFKSIHCCLIFDSKRKWIQPKDPEIKNCQNKLHAFIQRHPLQPIKIRFGKNTSWHRKYLMVTENRLLVVCST